MKKFIIPFALFAAITLVGIGCLKDKGFEDGRYGTEIQESPGVAFPQAASSPVVLGINAITGSQVIDGPAIVLEQSGNATGDVQVTLQVNNALVTTAGLTPLPTSTYTISNLVLTIPSGQKQVRLSFNIINSASLDPNITYGLGFTIASVTQGYKIAANQKNVVFGFNAKNKFDGIYRLFGVHNRPTLDAPYRNVLVHLITTGPDKVKMYWPAAGLDAHPINNAATYYGTFTTEFKFAVSAATLNPLLSVDNPYTPGSPPFTVGPAVNSRWSDTTIAGTAQKVIYAQYYYNNNLQRMFTDTIIYQGPR